MLVCSKTTNNEDIIININPTSDFQYIWVSGNKLITHFVAFKQEMTKCGRYIIILEINWVVLSLKNGLLFYFDTF